MVDEPSRRTKAETRTRKEPNMRSYDKYRDTKYIQKSEVEKPVLLTISKVVDEDVSGNGDMKYVLHFQENYKPWIPNIGSLEEIKSIVGTGDVDRWPGTTIVLYVNPDVEFAGKRVGGIRCRAPKAGYSQNQQINGSQDETIQQASAEDDIPF
jgi:hypothetical protein